MIVTMNYIKDDFLDWMYGVEYMTGGDFDDVYRASEIWKHAQKLLKTEDSPLYRSDCIGNLKRAINHRLKAIEKIYKIKSIPSEISSKKALDKFEELGLIRPNILKELVEVRNLIEHDDVAPPSQEKCWFYIDIVWYFLKSTDELVDSVLESFVYESGHDASRVYVKVLLEEPWKISISGYLHKSLFSDSGGSKFFALEAVADFDEKGFSKFNAKPVASEYYLKRFATEYFGLRRFWHDDRA